MKIRAIASPSFVFDAHPAAAKQLIEAGVYEAVPDNEPQSAEARQSPHQGGTVASSSAAAHPKARRKKAK